MQIPDAFPLYVALEEGYFKEEGLSVTIQPFKSSSEESQAISAGSVQIAMNDLIVESLLKKEGTDMRSIAMALGATPQEGRFVIVGAPGKNITTPDQLKGKKIAISTNTMMEFLSDSYLQHFHLKPSDVSYINMPNLLLRTETLLQGQDFDAAILPDPLATLALAKGGTAVIDDAKLGVNYSQSLIMSRQDWLQAHPQEAQAFLRAYNKAIEAINKNPEAYRALLGKTCRIPEPMLATYPMPTFTAQSLPSDEEVQRVQHWLVQKGLLNQAYPTKELLSTL